MDTKLNERLNLGKIRNKIRNGFSNLTIKTIYKEENIFNLEINNGIIISDSRLYNRIGKAAWNEIEFYYKNNIVVEGVYYEKN